VSVVSRGGEEFTKSSTPRSKADGLQSSRHETITEATARGKKWQHGAAYYTKHFPVVGGDKCAEGASGMIANDLHSPMCFGLTLQKKSNMSLIKPRLLKICVLLSNGKSTIWEIFHGISFFVWGPGANPS
jgi:hypothetical protein